ncbi:MAG: cytochrome c [Planctomycetes bacterium]|nr:cytochrome c [Planctomycetota bacterium]
MKQDKAGRPFRIGPTWIAAIACLAAPGCGLVAPEPRFRTNEAYLINQEIKQGDLEQSDRTVLRRNLKNLMVAAFGTPNEPHVPELEGIDAKQLFDPAKLAIAAGPVASDRFGAPKGLYREHCAHCHGITGDGNGSTAAFLNPYPRDYRRGLFKFKSTPGAEPPTHDDLLRVMTNGVPGTAMPSFRLLNGDEIDALIHYVRYLAIRGQVERALIEYSFQGELDLVEATRETLSEPESAAFVKSEIVAVATRWRQTETLATTVPSPPADFESAASIERGRSLFFGPIASCVKCHGETALGDGTTTDYDEWAKELMPNEPDKLARFLDRGAALEPRTIRPRNLRLNVFRGGRRPVDLYWRLHNGILASGMPAASMRSDGAGDDDPRLAPDDLWHLVAYVRSLPYDALSSPRDAVSYQRERP